MQHPAYQENKLSISTVCNIVCLTVMINYKIYTPCAHGTSRLPIEQQPVESIKKKSYVNSKKSTRKILKYIQSFIRYSMAWDDLCKCLIIRAKRAVIKVTSNGFKLP